jgi:histidine triad (HIT) family protein
MTGMTESVQDRPEPSGARDAAVALGLAGCPFCERIAREEFDYHDSRCVSFQPLSPVTPGHFLVVPREHTVSALTCPLSAGLAVRLAAELAGDMGLRDFTLITAAGKLDGPAVPHLHVHVIPRREGDGLALPWTGQKEKAPAVKLLEEALHLLVNGERAPGGDETWHDWADRAERFLRSLLPEPDAAP